MKKRIFSFFLMLALMIGVLSGTVFAENGTGGTTVSEENSCKIVTNDKTTSVRRPFISQCVVKGPKVLAYRIIGNTANAADTQTWNVTLAKDTDLTASIAYDVVISNRSSAMAKYSAIVFNGGNPETVEMVATSTFGKSFSAVPEWKDGKATVTFRSQYSMNPQANDGCNYILNYTLDDGINDAPTFDGDKSIDVRLKEGKSYSLNLNETFYDVDSMGLTYKVSVNGAEAVTTDANYVYTPKESGKTVFVFTATDDQGKTSEPLTVNLTVAPNAAPALVKDAVGTAEAYRGIPYSLDLTKVFTDIDDTTLTYSYTLNGENKGAAKANFSYTPNKVGTDTFVFKAKDPDGAESPEYTLTLTVNENPAPTLKEGINAEDTATVKQYSAWSINLANIFTDNAGDSLTYSVAIGDNDFTSASSSYRYTPDTDGEMVFKFRAKDKVGNFSPTYTVKLTVTFVPRGNVNTNCAAKEGITTDAWLSQITVTGAAINGYKWSVDAGHEESADNLHVAYIRLSADTPADAVIDLNYALGGNKNMGEMVPKSKTAQVQLENGKAVTTVKTVSGDDKLTRNYTLNFTNQANAIPAADPAVGTASLMVGDTYHLDLSTVFTDGNDDPLTYTVSVNGKDAEKTDVIFNQQILTAGKHVFVFTATDVWGASATYTVTVTAENSKETNDVTVNVPKGITPTFYYSDDAVEGTELTATAAENVYTVKIPKNLKTLTWRADGMGMSAAVSENASLTLVQTTFVVKVGDDTDKNASVAVLYGNDIAAVGKNNSFLLLNSEKYHYIATPDKELLDNYEVTEFTDQTADSGEKILNLNSKAIPITVPNGATVQVREASKTQSVEYDDIASVKAQNKVNEDGTQTDYFHLKNGTVYEYRVSKGNLPTYVATFTKDENTAITVTDEQLSAGGYTKTTVKHDLATYKNPGSLDSANIADLYLNVNAQGYMKMEPGSTSQLRAARAWWATSGGGWILSNPYYFVEPDFHYTVVGLDGQPNQDVVSVDEKGLISAKGKGTAIVLVTYDAMNVNHEANLYASCEKPDPNGFYGAIWPENTGVFVVSVGQENSGITTGMNINEKKSLKDKTAGTALDAEMDVIYFVGDQGEYTFTPGTKGVLVSVANPVITNGIMSFKGFGEALTENADGSYSVPLANGRNIVKIEKDGKAEYQVITAKSVSVKVNGKPLSEAVVSPGDKVSVEFDTLYNPVNRMALYNTDAAVVYNNVSGHKDKTAGNERGSIGYYFYGATPAKQTVANFNELSDDGSEYQNNTVKLGAALTVPDDFEEPYFTLSDGAFNVGGFSRYKMGDHRTVMGTEPSGSGLANNISSFFGQMPDISIPTATVDSIRVTTMPKKTEYAIGDVFDPTGMIVTATYRNSAGTFTKEISDYSCDAVAFTDSGDKEITVSYRYQGTVKTTVIRVHVAELEVTKIAVTTMPAKTVYKVGEAFDPTGMVVTATYNDNSTKAVNGYLCTPEVLGAKDTTITVTYGSKSTTIPITMNLVKGISVKTLPTKTEYSAGEYFDPAGMVVTVVYQDNTTAETKDYTFAPMGKLTTETTEVTVSYSGTDGVDGIAPATFPITVNGGSEPEEPGTITVRMSFIDKGQIVNGADGTLLYNAPVTVTDNDNDGKCTLGEAFSAFHKTYYRGGVNGYSDNGNLVTNFWGNGISGLSYVVNNNWVNGIAVKMADGDQAVAFVHTDTSSRYSDLYTWFEQDQYTTEAGEELTLNVNGLNILASSDTYVPKGAPVGATVSVYDEKGNKVSALSTVTDENGTFKLNFADPGTYTVEVSGVCSYRLGERSDITENAPVVPSRCTVVVKEKDIEKENLKAAKNVMDLIAKIGNVAKDSGEAIAAARSGYDLLTETQKEMVSNYDVLTAAEAAYAELIRVSENPFTDVKEGDYFYDAILWAVKTDITKGTSATTFEPAWICTRGQMVTFLYRAAGEPAVTAKECVFTDVAANAYYYNAVLWAVEKGITYGVSATEFAPEEPVTRGQVVTFLYRYAGEPGVSNKITFTDVAEGEYYYNAVLWALGTGITNGVSATEFAPKEGCTRGQIVTFLYRAR